MDMDLEVSPGIKRVQDRNLEDMKALIRKMAARIEEIKPGLKPETLLLAVTSVFDLAMDQHLIEEMDVDHDDAFMLMIDIYNKSIQINLLAFSMDRK